MLTRRRFLSLPAAVAVATLPEISAANTEKPPVLQAIKAQAQLVPDKYPKTDVWTFDGTIPGTTLRLKQGERLQRLFENKLPEPSSVHWHGIRIDNKMDGVPGLTQKIVEKNEQFLYDFVVPDAGTYWYHSHHRSWEQMARGLYGALIVEESNPPQVDRDQVLLIDDWRLDDKAQITNDFGQMMQMSHGGRLGNWLTINGVGMDISAMPVKQHERLRLRLINTANASIFSLRMEGLQGWVVAVDGQPLEQPEAPGDIVLAPAQRVDLIVDVLATEGQSAGLQLLSRNGSQPVHRFKVTGSEREQPLTEPEPLPPNRLPVIAKLDDVPLTELKMEGGAMGRMSSATYKGKETGIRELIKEGMAWSFNGVAGMTDTPLLTAKQGEPVRINLVNETSWPHGIHLHGHHFREVLADNKFGPWRDTLLLQRSESKEIAFVADNPGDWLLHCHMLEHQAAGMKTWFRVVK